MLITCGKALITNYIMQLKLNNIWKKTTEKLKSKFSTKTVDLWFSPTKIDSFEDNILTLKVPNKYFSNWMEKNKKDILEAIHSLEEFENTKIKFIIDTDDFSYKPPSKNELPEPTHFPENETNFPGSDLNPRYTFDAFVVGSSNRFAQATAEAVSNNPGTRYNPLFIYSGVGLGKTHLLHAIGHTIKSNNPRTKVRYITCEKFMQEMVDSMRKKNMPTFKKKFLNVSILLIDDIQFLENKERTQDIFFHIFNELYESQKQIVITSDKSPDKIKTLEERLSSRFQWGVIADIQPPDLETRIAILKSKAEWENLDVPNDVILFLATNIKDNVRKLEGALIRIYAHSSLMGSEVTVDNTKEILKDIIDKDKKLDEISTGKIQKIVADYYHVQVDDLKSKKRHKKIVFPRHLAMYLTRKLTDKSTTNIGNEFGGRDHTTVMYACNVIKDKLNEDPYFQNILDKIIEKIKAVS
ncbi:MAG: chromosomal replication initiator protein DnaA [Elusimicrobiota bacterium]